MTSRIAPRVARTSFASACGGYWKCRPRTVPFFLLYATLTCAIAGSSPFSANSRRQKARAKKPRSSSRRSRSRMKAPFSLVSVKITVLRFREEMEQSASTAQVGPQVSHGHQLLELVDAPEARPLEV